MVVFPHCKINLGLNITLKRGDGYHNLHTCFYPITALQDVLEVVPATTTTLKVTGTDLQIPTEKNIVYKAYQLLKNNYNLPAVEIHLHKVIPNGAGLGGGSGNAAAMLLLLNTMFNLQITKEQLLNYAVELGSDCPFFIDSRPAIGEGRGEVLFPLIHNPLAGKSILLIKPAAGVSTAQAFAGIVPKPIVLNINSILHQPLHTWQQQLVNDFEKTVFAQLPQLQAIKDWHYSNGAMYASLSGTGSTVYGIYNELPLNKYNDSIWSFGCKL